MYYFHEIKTFQYTQKVHHPQTLTENILPLRREVNPERSKGMEASNNTETKKKKKSKLYNQFYL